MGGEQNIHGCKVCRDIQPFKGLIKYHGWWLIHSKRGVYRGWYAGHKKKLLAAIFRGQAFLSVCGVDISHTRDVSGSVEWCIASRGAPPGP
jgi:hypothetical protein